jgi:hypothetical protein
MEHDFHRALKRQTADHFTDNGWSVFQEFVLPDRTIADVFAYRDDRGYCICEVATLYTASKAINAIRKYRAWCHRLYLATPETFVVEQGEGRQLIQWLQQHDRIGLLSLTRKRIRVIREPEHVYLHPRTTQLLRDRMDLSLKLIESGVPTATEEKV